MRVRQHCGGFVSMVNKETRAGGASPEEVAADASGRTSSPWLRNIASTAAISSEGNANFGRASTARMCPATSPNSNTGSTNPRSPARETTLRDWLLIKEVRFAAHSPLEGEGFGLSSRILT